MILLSNELDELIEFNIHLRHRFYTRNRRQCRLFESLGLCRLEGFAVFRSPCARLEP